LNWIKVHSKASKKELRSFGLLMGGMIFLLFGLLFPWLLEKTTWPISKPLLIICCSFIGLGILLPILLKPIYILWMGIGGVLGYINTKIILTLVYFGLFLPVGIIRRIFVKDPLKLKYDASADSYRIKRESVDWKTRMKAPY